jgi:hypothetical protein
MDELMAPLPYPCPNCGGSLTGHRDTRPPIPESLGLVWAVCAGECDRMWSDWDGAKLALVHPLVPGELDLGVIGAHRWALETCRSWEELAGILERLRSGDWGEYGTATGPPPNPPAGWGSTSAEEVARVAAANQKAIRDGEGVVNARYLSHNILAATGLGGSAPMGTGYTTWVTVAYE